MHLDRHPPFTPRLRRSPEFSLVVTTTFALAIGANTTIFSLLNANVLRAVPAADPDRFVAISTTDTRTMQPAYIYVDTTRRFVPSSDRSRLC
jgi:hypothetical protein